MVLSQYVGGEGIRNFKLTAESIVSKSERSGNSIGGGK